MEFGCGRHRHVDICVLEMSKGKIFVGGVISAPDLEPEVYFGYIFIMILDENYLA